MKFECKWVMEVNDEELLEMVNDYQDSSDEPQFGKLEDVPHKIIMDTLYDSDYISIEISDYLMVEDLDIKKL